MTSSQLQLARAGYFLIVVAIVLFGALVHVSAESNDPAEVMRLAGQLSGVFAGLGIALVIADRLRRRRG